MTTNPNVVVLSLSSEDLMTLMNILATAKSLNIGDLCNVAVVIR